MTSLIVLGNINHFTFANSVIVANAKVKEGLEQGEISQFFNLAFLTHTKTLGLSLLWAIILDKSDDPSQALSNIFVIHSKDSYIKLKDNEDWIDHIEADGISRELFVEKIIDITEEQSSITKFVDYLEFILKGIPIGQKLIIDLTNGTSFQKNLLSIASYILDIKHQYLIDVSKLSKLTKKRGFLPVNILLPCYTLAPDTNRLDRIAYLNLSEMVRYKKIIEHQTSKYIAIDPDASDEEFFGNNLGHSIQLKLQGDQSKDNAIYRIAASSISASVEDLIRLLINKFMLVNLANGVDRRTFGQKLKIIEAKFEHDTQSDFDLEFFRKFNDFMLYLRNSSTHKGQLLTPSEKFKAELSVIMAFPFIDFYTDIVYDALSKSKLTKKPKKIRKLTDILPEENLYYGLDGDDTGKILEELFLACSDEAKFRKSSKQITEAISEIARFIRKKVGKKSVIFEAGDDLLFKGNLENQILLEIQTMYSQLTSGIITSGLTCSIGYGRSFQEVYLALKLAKTQPGKNSIIGIELC
ncbi:MAG: mCpol domain-containing protein [Crocosphaera sp.]